MDKIIIRFQTNDGFVAYEIDTTAIGKQAEIQYREMQSEIPKAFKIPVDAFLFAMRHGPLHKIMALVKPPKEDVESVTVGLLMNALLQGIAEKSKDENGVYQPIDITKQDIGDLYGEAIKRAPQWDCNCSGELHLEENPYALLDSATIVNGE